MNRLQYELSPYLVSHAADPIDWYPWGAQALEAAKVEGRPLLIAVGTQTADSPARGFGTAARIIGRYFVPVQVDARAHPEVAAYYLRAGRALQGAAACPLTVLADPDGRPFYVTGALGEVELAGLLCGAALHWNSDPGAYLRVAEVISGCGGERRASSARPYRTDVGEAEDGQAERQVAVPYGCGVEVVKEHFRVLGERFDGEYGGFGQGAKGLLPQELLFLLAYARRFEDRGALEMAGDTLRAMAESPVRDSLGGGFFHGTADRQWQLPLPEKRLLDQAWLLECYLAAFACTGAPLFARVARETADFVLRELRHPAGGFYAAQWSRTGFYDCRSAGSDIERYRLRLELGRPEREEAILVGQNGVMLAALCRAGRLLGVRRYLDAACAADSFLRRRLVGRTDLRRYWCSGAAAGEGALEDYAGYALGQVELYRSGCGAGHLAAAARVMARADALFAGGDGGYHLARGLSGLPERPMQLWDEEVPCAWAVAVQVVRALSEETGHPGYRRRAAELTEAALRGDSVYGLAVCM